MPPSKIDSLLQAIGNALRSKDGINIRNLTRVEPQLDGSDGEWISLGQEVKTRYPASSPKSSQLLDARCEQLLPAEPDTVASEGDRGHAWPAFIQFIRTYLEFWRDVDFQDLISVHRLLSGLVK